jgi:glycosyltransferase involved in cell wall biosynthesis
VHWVWQQADNKKLTHNARQKILDNFTEERVSARYVELYKKIIDQA